MPTRCRGDVHVLPDGGAYREGELPPGHDPTPLLGSFRCECRVRTGWSSNALSDDIGVGQNPRTGRPYAYEPVADGMVRFITPGITSCGKMFRVGEPIGTPWLPKTRMIGMVGFYHIDGGSVG